MPAGLGWLFQGLTSRPLPPFMDHAAADIIERDDLTRGGRGSSIRRFNLRGREGITLLADLLEDACKLSGLTSS